MEIGDQVESRDGGGEGAVVARGLVKRYGELTAVGGIDFDVRRGTCLGVLGPNGAGKTTTIEILEGLKTPDGGEVEVLGRRWRDDRREIQERIGVQLQETELEEKLTVFELLRVFRSFYRQGAEIEEVMRTIGLEEKRDAQVRTLSGGQKQRLAVGCALINRPEVLFLDEPSTGLDPQARRQLWQVIESFKSGGGTVVLTTHYMEEAERLADVVLIVDRGQVIARGSPAEVIATLGAESLVRFSLHRCRSARVVRRRADGARGGQIGPLRRRRDYALGQPHAGRHRGTLRADQASRPGARGSAHPPADPRGRLRVPDRKALA